MIIAPPVVSVPLWWLLVEIGVHRTVSLFIAIAYAGVGSFTFLLMLALSAMDGNPKSRQAPPSAVLYFLGQVGWNLLYLVAAPVMMIGGFLAVRVRRVIKGD